MYNDYIITELFDLIKCFRLFPLKIEQNKFDSVIKSHHFYAILPVSENIFSWESVDFISCLKHAAQTVGLTVVGELAFTFPNQGVSAIVLLLESHIALHFWPEESKVTVDIHICDYQRENCIKAQMLTQILTTKLSHSNNYHCWHYSFVNG